MWRRPWCQRKIAYALRLTSDVKGAIPPGAVLRVDQENALQPSAVQCIDVLGLECVLQAVPGCS